jgi:hypothetical protein
MSPAKIYDDTTIFTDMAQVCPPPAVLARQIWPVGRIPLPTLRLPTRCSRNASWAACLSRAGCTTLAGIAHAGKERVLH